MTRRCLRLFRVRVGFLIGPQVRQSSAALKLLMFPLTQNEYSIRAKTGDQGSAGYHDEGYPVRTHFATVATPTSLPCVDGRVAVGPSGLWPLTVADGASSVV